jgi:hypothetical protein
MNVNDLIRNFNYLPKYKQISYALIVAGVLFIIIALIWILLS